MRDGGARPAVNRPATKPTVRGRYCRNEGWQCTPDARCNEHRLDRDPVRLGDLLGGRP